MPIITFSYLVLFVEKLYVSGEKYFVGLKLRTAIVPPHIFSIHHSSSLSEVNPPVFLPFCRMEKTSLTKTKSYERSQAAINQSLAQPSKERFAPQWSAPLYQAASRPGALA